MLKTKLLYLVSALVGVVCGVISNYSLLAGSWWDLVFWAVVGIGLGFFANAKKEIVWAGILYGLFLTLSFLFSGFRGTSDKLPGFTLLAALLSILGAGCGLACAFMGSWIRGRLRSQRS